MASLFKKKTVDGEFRTELMGPISAFSRRLWGFPTVILAPGPGGGAGSSGPTDVIKEQNRELRGTQRAIIRDRAALEKQEKQLELEIKKMAKIGNKEACRVLAKQLVHLRKQKTRTFAVSSKVTSMSTQTKVMNSQMKMAGAMSTTAKTMQAVNKKMDPQKTLQTMQNFQKENMKMEMTEEMINDTLDDIFDGSDDEEESQDIVNQVLDEIGIEISGKMAKAPSAARSLPSASTSKATISDEEIERQLKALGVD
ncbi:Charged multivesicular body protein 2b [Tupaia chinensis]|uniref:Charged multivesicular body protein 2b n=1 Tax=Tupaia chinensis TaxID=246437 RepID=L9K7Q0_TUPCH|nr:Charged multivesicular body protein 2b [Tupaia chinensis]